MKTMMLLSLNRATRLRFSYKIGIVTQPATIHLYILKKKRLSNGGARQYVVQLISRCNTVFTKPEITSL